MSRRTWFTVVAVLGLALPAPAQTDAAQPADKPKVTATAKTAGPAKGDAKAPKVDDLVAKNIEARGGKQKIQAVQTMRLTMKAVDAPLPITISKEAKRPRSFRQDVSIEDETMSTGYDGQRGWTVNPFSGGKVEAEDMTPDELRLAEESADMDGELLDYKAKGHQIEYMGTEQVDGRDTYKLKVTLKNGDVKNVFLDATTFLDVKQSGKRTLNDTQIEAETYFGDYKPVNGLMMPYTLEAGAVGVPNRQKLRVEMIEINVPIEDARFARPPKPGPHKITAADVKK